MACFEEYAEVIETGHEKIFTTSQIPSSSTDIQQSWKWYHTRSSFHTPAGFMFQIMLVSERTVPLLHQRRCFLTARQSQSALAAAVLMRMNTLMCTKMSTLLLAERIWDYFAVNWPLWQRGPRPNIFDFAPMSKTRERENKIEWVMPCTRTEKEKRGFRCTSD